MKPVSGMISVSANMLEKCHRTEFWRSLSSPFYDVSPLNDEQVIEGRLDSRLMGSFMIGKRWFDARVNLRDSLRIARGEWTAINWSFSSKAVLSVIAMEQICALPLAISGPLTLLARIAAGIRRAPA